MVVSFEKTNLLCGLTIPISLWNTPMSAKYASHTRRGKNSIVRTPSIGVTTSGVQRTRITMSHRYAKSEKEAVTVKTDMSFILRDSPSGMAEIQTAIMTKRLNAALPTMVEGPRAPLLILFGANSITLSKISGALEPKAIRVRFATVSFQTFTVFRRGPLFVAWSLSGLGVVPLPSHGRSPSATGTCFFAEVIFSIAPMKTSDMIPTP
mmetsp:Transcript_53584/g.139607  ORF Transcript_53584/g.139607 Transcript_53584/m.139607 type:complete len:208 (+) Transcript_53584:1487-2110(+)